MTSQPAAQPSQPSQPLSTFDAEIFWALHKQKILIGISVLIVVLLGGSVYFGLQAVKAQKAEAAYASADSIEGWQAVIREFPRLDRGWQLLSENRIKAERRRQVSGV